MKVESVWDYPRPPRLEPVAERVVLVWQGRELLATDAALRVLETSHPPVYYLPRAAFAEGSLQPSAARSTFCEFKGVATYLDLLLPVRVEAAGWSYARPTGAFAALAGHVALYAGRLHAAGIGCRVGTEDVTPQPGEFYGGWITPNLRGPFKGAPGTRGW